MTKKIWQMLLAPYHFKPKDLVIFVSIAVVWLTILKIRPHVIDPVCGENPEMCDKASVPFPDNVSINLIDKPFNEKAHELSFITQNATAVIAGCVLVAIDGAILISRSMAPSIVLAKLFSDLFLLTESVLLNGAVNETIRILFPRPRPHVYHDPEYSGPNPAHYTSFYSGHTSFAAVMSFGLVLVVAARRLPKQWIYFFSCTGFCLTFLTGLFRILARRHFISDVVVGAIMGVLLTAVVFWFHKRHKKAQVSF